MRPGAEEPLPEERLAVVGPTWKLALSRVLKRRCPRCGEGALFASYFRLERSCTGCSLEYRREPGAMTGQMYLSAAVTQVFAALLIAVVFLATDWGPLTSISVGVPVVGLFSFWFLPRAMALWVWVEYATDRGSGDLEG